MRFAIPELRMMNLSFAILILLALSSCISQKKTNYFNDLQTDPTVQLQPLKEDERVIDKGDDLDISFDAGDVESVKPFNKLAVMSPGAAVGTTAPIGYTVSNDGYIELPVLGRIKVVGLTSSRLKNNLEQATSQYIKNPVVNVKFNTFKVTLLGEVRAPGTYNLPVQKTTIFDALAAGGDIPLTAKKYNVQLYRDYNGVRSVSTINLTESALLNDKNFFYMKPNDVIYVRTRKNSIFSQDFAIFSAITTLVVSIVTLGITVTNN